MTMKRDDRRDYNYDDAVNHPRSRQQEPVPCRELEQSVVNLSTLYDEAKQVTKKNEETASQLVHVQQEVQTYQVEINELKEPAAQNY